MKAGSDKGKHRFSSADRALSGASTADKPVFRGNKSFLPSKDCAACGQPFSWRKKWARNWDNVRYCSDRCRAVPGQKG
ncbi:MAG: DUF2256 domain-containing protein [Bacteroidetes bacterium]|nr:DUF2256 domain-containing protein [Bacteroidota bacterium]